MLENELNNEQCMDKSVKMMYFFVLNSDWPIWIKRGNIYPKFASNYAHTFKIRYDGLKYYGCLQWEEALEIEDGKYY